MHAFVRMVAVLVLGLQVSPIEAGQSRVRVEFTGYRVTVEATDAEAQAVLAAWARAGGTEFEGAERLAGRRVTLALTGVTETDALADIAGPAFGIAGWVKPGPAPREMSRFARVAIVPLAAAPPAQQHAVAGAPEARFSYSEPARAHAATDIPLPTAPTASPVDPADRPAPETVFEYWRPAHAETSAADSPFAAGSQPARHPAPGVSNVDPEARFDYFVPARAVPPRDPETGAPAPPDPGLGVSSPASNSATPGGGAARPDEARPPEPSRPQGPTPAATPAFPQAPGPARAAAPAVSPNGSAPAHKAPRSKPGHKKG